MAKNPWTEYYAAKSQLEKEEILKKLYPGISEEGLAIFRRKYTPEELADFVKEFTSPESYPRGIGKTSERSHLTMDMERSQKLWEMYCDSESESEKEAILKKICPEITEEGLEIMRRKMPVPDEPKKAENETGGLLTQEEILDILSGEVSPEEMISRWDKKSSN